MSVGAQYVIGPTADTMLQRRTSIPIRVATDTADVPPCRRRDQPSRRRIQYQQLIVVAATMFSLAASGTVTESSAPVGGRHAFRADDDRIPLVREYWLKESSPVEEAAAAAGEAQVDGDRRQVDVIVDRGRRHGDGADDDEDIVAMSDAAAAAAVVATVPEEDPAVDGRLSTATKPHCQYPCSCQKDPPRCKMGNTIKDGCNCCHICPRQQGDLCDHKFRCDEERGLYCELSLDDGHRGICRAKSPKSCEVDGKTYKDGEEIRTCSQLCTCQNGQYACASLCPQEDRPPSRTHCRDAQLVTIIGQCCREWVCPHAHSLPQPDDIDPLGPAGFPSASGTERCIKETTEWSPCSVSCGMGISTRLTNNNKDCQSRQERQLCLIRPCNLDDKHIEGKECKNTWRHPPSSFHIEHHGCTSVKEFRPKYCSTCKRQRCCAPDRTDTRRIEMRCPTSSPVHPPSTPAATDASAADKGDAADEKIIVENFMWIKSCKCSESKCEATPSATT